MATPEQCPECARFLSKTLVSGLADADAKCPKCGATLTAAMFGVTDDTSAAAPPTADRPAPKRVVPGGDASVRPPDVLEGWDADGPTDYGVPPEGSGVVALPAEVALAVGVACAGAGFVIARRHPMWGAVLGAAAGVVAAAAGRTIYQRDR